jgi:hypothetical protein
MSEETKDVNTSGEEVIETDMSLGQDNITDDHHAGVGSSADENESHQLDIDDYDKVIENANADSEEASGETETTDESGEEEVRSGKEDKGGEPRVPKSRLDEVIGERNTEREQRVADREAWARERGLLEGRLQALESAARPTEPEAVDPFEELLSSAEPQAIIDALQENPAEFFSNLRRSSEAKAQQNIAAQQQEQKYYDDLRNGLDAFAADHDGFMDSIERMHGIVTSNPIHNLVSAYAYEVEIPALVESHKSAIGELEGKIEAAKAEGIKVGKAEALKEFQAKGAAAVLDGSQSSQGGKTVIDPEIADTEKSGGLAKVLTDKLLKRRAASGG